LFICKKIFLVIKQVKLVPAKNYCSLKKIVFQKMIRNLLKVIEEFKEVFASNYSHQMGVGTIDLQILYSY